MSADVVPVIDVGPFLSNSPAGRRSIPQAVARSCEGIGFFTIVGHGVDPELIRAAAGVAGSGYRADPAANWEPSPASDISSESPASLSRALPPKPPELRGA